jgi:hypothetical protein
MGAISGMGCPPGLSRLPVMTRKMDHAWPQSMALPYMMDLKASTLTLGAAAHISASFTMSRAGTSHILLMAAGVLFLMKAISPAMSPSRTHLSQKALSCSPLVSRWLHMPRNRAASPPGRMGIHQSALAASVRKMGSMTTSFAPRSLASRMSRGTQASSRQPKGWRPDRIITPPLGTV